MTSRRQAPRRTATRDELAQQVGFAMQRYQRSTEAFDDAVGRALGLNPADRRCLDRLTDGPATAGGLSEATGLRPAATTTLIDRLAERGWVRRVPSPTDRRQVLVELTEHGRDRVWEAYGPLVEEGARMMAHLSAAELETMRDHLEAIRDLTDRHRLRVVSGSKGS